MVPRHVLVNTSAHDHLSSVLGLVHVVLASHGSLAFEVSRVPASRLHVHVIAKPTGSRSEVELWQSTLRADDRRNCKDDHEWQQIAGHVPSQVLRAVAYSAKRRIDG
uniref:Putative secreted protein n=1 Tax=Amblyomma tuberculatum TaxID=48802 RepID=A0A6M2E1E5_9ACAR